VLPVVLDRRRDGEVPRAPLLGDARVGVAGIFLREASSPAASCSVVWARAWASLASSSRRPAAKTSAADTSAKAMEAPISA
jgi:hypothetical protein